MGELGLIPDDIRTELLDGFVYTMKPPRPGHSGRTTRSARLLPSPFTGRGTLRFQEPIHQEDGTQPQPDIAFCTWREDDYREAHPTPLDIFLLIEVSDTTLKKDRTLKLRKYAPAGIPETWFLNLQADTLEHYRDPIPDDPRCGSTQTLRGGDTLAPVAFLAVADLLG